MKIRSDILRVYQTLHTWVGITAGTLLFIGFFAGALTMFKQPLERWVSPPTHRLAFVETTQLNQLVMDVLATQPAARTEFSVHLAHHENITAPVTWSDGGRSRELDLSATQWQATLNHDNTLIVEKITPGLLAELIDMLHRTAGIPGFIDGEYIGTYVMGVAAVLYFLALVSGLILLLPTLTKDFLALRTGKNRKRFWLDVHNIIGIASLPYHLVISLTVIVFAFHDQFYGALQQVVYRDTPMFSRPAAAPETYEYQQLLPVTELLARIQQEAPEFTTEELLFMGVDTKTPRVRAALKSSRYILQGPQTAYLILNPYTGKILDSSMLPTKANSWGLTTTTFFALHFGSYGGDLVRGVYFLLGLSGAFLFYSGNLLWIESRRKKQRQQTGTVKQALNTRIIASLTVGICLGSILGVAAAMVAGKWLSAQPNQNDIYIGIYYLVFLVAILWSLIRGAAKAALELLIVTIFAIFCIPLTSVASFFIPSLWINTSAAALGVDITAIMLAVLLIQAARVTARRIKTGPTDSLWSAPTKNSVPTSTHLEVM